MDIKIYIANLHYGARVQMSYTVNIKTRRWT